MSYQVHDFFFQKRRGVKFPKFLFSFLNQEKEGPLDPAFTVAIPGLYESQWQAHITKSRLFCGYIRFLASGGTLIILQVGKTCEECLR
jgi:hypothetical protein